MAEEASELYQLRFNIAVEPPLTNNFDSSAMQRIDLNELGGRLRKDEYWVSVMQCCRQT